MARRQYKRLTTKGVEKLSKIPGMHPDGDGLYLQVTPTLVPSWIYRYQVGKSQHPMGLGPLRHVTLAEARKLRDDAWRLRRAGIDPLEARRAAKRAKSVEAAKIQTFKQCALAYVAAHRIGWKNTKHQQQWSLSLERYVFPYFGDGPVGDVDVALIMRALEPIWRKRPETASRVRQRIEAVLDFATTLGYRQGENPARWRGHLSNLLPKKSSVRPVVHHAALPYRQVAAFMTDLQRVDAITARLLEFLILTAVRSGEARGARWDEIDDLATKVWTIPVERMKSKKAHRVPLSEPALKLLSQMAEIRSGPYVFTGRTGGPLSSSALPQFLRTIGRTDITAHGMRSAFRDWAGEETHFPREVCEAALAHSSSNSTEAAYARGDLFQKRRQLMEAWGRYCSAPPVGDVVPIRAAKR